MKKTQNHQERLREERQQCVRVLLNRPWVLKEEDPETFQLIKDHYESLRDWFHEFLGFSLLVTRHFAKLEKFPGTYRPWMGMEGFLTVRDYALFAYCLWFLEGRGEGEQFLLSQMVEEIREHLLLHDVHVDWTLYEHRLSMARALKKCKELRVLVAVDGDESEWARDGEGVNVLYESTPMARYVLRRFPKELTGMQTIDELVESGDDREEKVRRRRNVYRRLVQEPVVYDWEWSEEERYYVLTQRRSILDQMSEFVGLEGRRYREGLIFYEPSAVSPMTTFPTQAAISDILVLMAGEIRRRRQEGAYEMDEWGRLRLSVTELESVLLALRDRHQAYWSKEHRESSSQELLRQVIQHLEEWNLGKQMDGQEIWLYPALARWSGAYGNGEGGIG
ncbi:TIGR02678 family protein [Bacillaceae bacterium]